MGAFRPLERSALLALPDMGLMAQIAEVLPQARLIRRNAPARSFWRKASKPSATVTVPWPWAPPWARDGCSAGLDRCRRS
jgi:hypothetical protein